MDNVIAALVGAIIGAAVAIVVSILQRRWAQEDKERDRQILRRSLRALLRDEIAHNLESVRNYQGYLEKTELDTHELTMPEQYAHLVAKPIHVWHAMWQGQAQHLGVVLEPNEIVATARFHNDLDSLVTDWKRLDGVQEKKEEIFERIKREHSDPSIQERLGKTVEETYLALMSEHYKRFTQETLPKLSNTANPIGPDD